MKSKFDRIATKYDSFMDKFNLYKEKDIEELIDLGKISTLLDLGAGTCHYSNYFSDKVNVVAIDSSENMLKYANKSVRTIISDITHKLPLSDDSFDCVLINDVIHHLPKDKHNDFLKEVHRVLAPGGQVIIYDFEKKHLLTKILHIFEFFLFFEGMNYLNLDNLVIKLKKLFEIKEVKKFKNIYILRCDKCD